MPASTPFNQPPYFDDFDETKNFHRILFKPSVAVQARELTQLQTILQNQVERFGDNILVQGTIVKGCDLTEMSGVGYVKVLDNQADGAPVSMNSYKDHIATGSVTGVKALVFEVAPGFESQTPDLSTLFVKYYDTGTNGEKEFAPSEVIQITDINSGAPIGDVVAAGTVDAESIGKAYAVRTSDGIIYQKGFFVRVEDQITIVAKYTNRPTDVSIGFETQESIVTHNADTSLLDNATGAPNENAPGADRLKLTPVMVVKPTNEAYADENFLIIQEYQAGRVIRSNGTTQYSTIFDKIEERTFEESGNYVIKDFTINITANNDPSNANNEFLDLRVGSGVGYIEGKRTELLNELHIPLEKSTAFETEIQQNITTNYGNYIIVDEYIGSFDFDQNCEIALLGTAPGRFTAGSVGSDPGSHIGSARVRSLIHHSGAKGSASTRYRLYLFDINMNGGNKFEDVEGVFYDGTNKGAADVVQQNGRTVLQESSFRAPLFYIGRDSIKEIPAANTDYVYRNVDASLTAAASTGEITIILAGNNEWPYGIGALNNTQKQEIEIISNETQSPYTAGMPIPLNNATVVVNTSQQMTITLATPPAAEMDVIAYYDVKRTSAAPAGKDLREVYIRINPNTHPNGVDGPWSLGLPDVHAITGIWKGSNYSESNADVRSGYILEKNQFDTYYGLSYIRKRPTQTVTTADRILVKCKVFQKNTSGSFAEGFFSVDSYPIDDANTANNTALTTEGIPVYTSESGQKIDLRNVIDFRPYPANNAAYATTIGGSTENPIGVAGLTFPTTDSYFPSPNKNFEADYSYYLGRSDLLFIDSRGTFQLSHGDPAELPVPPADPDSGMVLVTVDIPPFPSLPNGRANIVNKPEYGVTIRKRNNRRYTMRDIGGIERRVNSLEYYASLNALEQDTINMLITDASGANRFKNGIFVDNFRDFNIADVSHPDFSAALDPTFHELTPRLNITPLDLRTNGAGTNILNYANSDISTLSYYSRNVRVSEQLHVTKFRNCVTDFHSFDGVMRMVPEYDSGYDTTRAPGMTIDLSDQVSDFADALSDFIPMQSVSTDTAVNQVANGDIRVTTTTTTTNNKLTIGNPKTTKVGDFVTDIRFNPFMQTREIKIVVNGLRPNTKHWFFFDGQDVNAHVAPGTRDDDGVLVRAGKYGVAGLANGVTTNGAGRLLAIFRIPANTFYVGDRKMEIYDTNLYNSIDSATSSASYIYRAFNIDVEKTAMSTRIPQINTSSSSRTSSTTRMIDPPEPTIINNITNNTVIVPPPEPAPTPAPEPAPADPVQTTRPIITNSSLRGTQTRSSDPIAQTFFVNRTETADNAIHISMVDVFFRTKDANKGVTLQIRNVENGYPAKSIVPFGSSHLEASEVNTGPNGGVFTRFFFDGPVVLKTGQEYCIVVKPDGNSPNYTIAVAKTGETDLLSNTVIKKDVHGGTLFTSTNNRAWTPYQDENLRFRVMRYSYGATGGELPLTNMNHEFLELRDIQGEFVEGEQVGTLSANNPGTLNIQQGNRTITGTGTGFLSNLSVGDHIGIFEDANYKHITRVRQVVNNTTIVVQEAPFVSNTSCNYFISASGVMRSFNRNEPAKMVLSNSAVREPAALFSPNTVIFGEQSQATAVIEETENKFINFLQPNIRRSNSSKTRTSLRGSLYNSNINSMHNRNLSFVDNSYITGFPAIIKSRTNEVIDGTGKSFIMTVLMRNLAESSPIVDSEISNVNVYTYVINNDLTGEEGAGGNALSKYISKPVQLADGLDADDLKLFVTGYRPPGTDIHVYVRFQAESDPASASNIPWTKLILKPESNAISSNANRFDYKEFEYGLPSLASGSFVAGGGAALNTDNSDIIRYVNDDGAIFDRYKFYTVKIVLTTSAQQRVPRVKDIRAIALS